MESFILLLIVTALVNNVVLVNFLGLCPFIGTSGKVETAVGMGFAATFVMTLSSALAWVIERFLLAPFDLAYLRTLTLIMVIAAIVQFTEMFVRRTSPALYRTLGIFLPLITTNCAVLGVALLNIQGEHDFLHSLLYGFGSALGFSFVLIVFAGLRERLALADVPPAFAGAPVAFIIAGLLSLAFMGFAGIGAH